MFAEVKQRIKDEKTFFIFFLSLAVSIANLLASSSAIISGTANQYTTLIFLTGLIFLGNAALSLARIAIATGIMLATITALLLYLIYYGGSDGGGIYTLYLAPFFYFFLGGRKNGVLWHIILLALIGLMVYLQNQGALITAYETDHIARVAYNLVIVSVFFFVYEKRNEHYETRITGQNNQLAAINKSMAAEIVRRKKIERDLKEGRAELEKLNKFMVGREIKMARMKEELEKLKG